MVSAPQPVRISLVLKLTIAVLTGLATLCLNGQEAAAPAPKLRLNMVNVCTPSDADRSELSAALARIPERPALGSDFEVARGRTTEQGVSSDWVRLRRDFLPDGPFSNVQFLLSVTGVGIDETLVLHFKATKPGEPLQLSLANEQVAGTPAAVLNADTPPGHIRLERFGKSSLILARCPNVDQGAYEPLFRVAAQTFAGYRAALKVRATVSAELERLHSSTRKNGACRGPCLKAGGTTAEKRTN
jgi:hypothetical protein